MQETLSVDDLADQVAEVLDYFGYASSLSFRNTSRRVGVFKSFSLDCWILCLERQIYAKKTSCCDEIKIGVTWCDRNLPDWMR